MTVKRRLCKLLDTGEKGYITIDDVKDYTINVGLGIAVVYVTYNEMSPIAGVNLVTGFIALLGCVVLLISISAFLCYKIDEAYNKIRNTKLLKCNHKEKQE